jgi:hypothetical protein
MNSTASTGGALKPISASANATVRIHPDQLISYPAS